MTLILSLLVATMFLGVGLFLLLMGHCTLKPERRHRIDAGGRAHASISLWTVRLVGLIFLAGGIAAGLRATGVLPASDLLEQHLPGVRP